METFSCGRSKCKLSVYKYCLNCKTMLCRKHRIIEIKERQKNKAAEHHYVDVSKFYYKTAEFSCLYCKEHPNEMLAQRCINCDLFACKECAEDWCPNAAGRYHDFDPIRNFVCIYKDRTSEFRRKLQLNHNMLLKQLKEACRKLDKTSSDLEKMLKTVDSMVETQIIAIRGEGETFKKEIFREIFKEKCQLSEKVKSIQAKEAISRQLLHDISELLKTADGAMVVHNYSRLKEQMTNLLTSEAEDSASISFKLVEDAELGPLCLRLQKTNLYPMPVSEGYFHSEVKAAEIKRIGQYYSTHTLQSLCVTYLSADKIITGLFDLSSSHTTIEVIESGKITSRRLFKFGVIQLVPYGSQILMLSAHPSEHKYKVLSMSNKTVLYEYDRERTADSESKQTLSYTPRMAVTSDHRLVVLDAETQTLHIVSLIKKAENEVFELENLCDGMETCGLMASSDGKLILSCVMERRFFIVKYDTSLHQMIWVSSPLGEYLPVYIPMGENLPHGLLKDRLFVCSYKDYIYAISKNDPTKVWRLNLSDGFSLQEISSTEFPDNVTNISLRGNTLAVAAVSEGIKVFGIADTTDVI